MLSKASSRAARRAASEAALLDAAVARFADAGPDGVSLREVAGSAGLDHALVARYFGSKQGLVAAVEDRLAAELRELTDTKELSNPAVIAELLASVCERPRWKKLIVRSGLGDIDPSIVPSVIADRCDAASADRRRRLGGYAAASLVLGWLSWDGFFRAALHLQGLSRHRQHRAMAAAAASLIERTTHGTPELAPRRLGQVARKAEAPPGGSAREALLGAAVGLFAERGPASVSIRDVARRAGVSHGLVHRHFGSKEDLLAEAIDVGTFALLPGASAPGGFDIDTVVHAMHHGSPSARTIARLLVDDVAVVSVRPRYPVLESLAALVRQLPADRRLECLADPRLASAAAASVVVGSVIFGPGLRSTFGVVEDDGVEAAMADLSRWLIGATGAPAGRSSPAGSTGTG